MASTQASFDSMLRRFDENRTRHDEFQRSLEELKDMMRTLLAMETCSSSIIRSVSIPPHRSPAPTIAQIPVPPNPPMRGVSQADMRFAEADMETGSLNQDLQGISTSLTPMGGGHKQDSTPEIVVPVEDSTQEIKFEPLSNQILNPNPRATNLEANSFHGNRMSEQEFLGTPPKEIHWGHNNSSYSMKHLNNGGLPDKGENTILLDFTSEIATLAPSHLGLELNLEAKSEKQDREELCSLTENQEFKELQDSTPSWGQLEFADAYDLFDEMSVGVNRSEALRDDGKLDFTEAFASLHGAKRFAACLLSLRVCFGFS